MLGWWVAGDIPSVGQLPITGSATYAGDAIATVATNLFDDKLPIPGLDGWTTYVATGDLKMNWNFGTRSGNLTVSHFDASHFPSNGGLNFTGSMCAPGVTSCGGSGEEWSTPQRNHFGGKLSGQLPDNLDADTNLSGFALGSFARGPGNYQNGLPITGSTPEGVIGNWGVGNDRYIASGIFAGAKQ